MLPPSKAWRDIMTASVFPDTFQFMETSRERFWAPVPGGKYI